MNLYAITKTDYIGHHICAMTTDKDKAEKLRRIFDKPNEPVIIEEYEDGDNGEVRVLWSVDDWGVATPCYEEKKETVLIIPSTREVCGARVFASDKETARKKAYDMIAKYMAEKAGI